VYKAHFRFDIVPTRIHPYKARAPRDGINPAYRKSCSDSHFSREPRCRTNRCRRVALRKPVIRFGIDLTDHSHVGPAIIALLEAIGASGSLSQAARDLKISYRHAWLLVDGLKSTFEAPVTLATRGGRNGGGVSLTKLGQSLVLDYRALEREFGEIAASRLQGITPLVRRIG
jgi:molybdate transport system regulatory protein